MTKLNMNKTLKHLKLYSILLRESGAAEYDNKFTSTKHQEQTSHMFLLSSRVCAFADASVRHRHGEGLLHQCDQRHRRRGVSVSGLRSDTPQLPAGRLLLRPLPRRVLHRQRHQPMPGVPAQHAPGRAPHLRPGRVCRLWARKRKQQGKETGCHSMVFVCRHVSDMLHGESSCVCVSVRNTLDATATAPSPTRRTTAR